MGLIKNSINRKKYMSFFPDRMTTRKLFLISTACVLSILAIAGTEFHVNHFSISGHTGKLMQAGFIPGSVNPVSVPDETLHIHFISGSREYKSEELLEKLKEIFEEDFRKIRITSSRGQDAGDDLPDIHKLAVADLMLVFTRRMTLPDDQLAYILKHVEDEKPVIGIRTASHAFQDFLEMDAQVFGGDYDGHGDDEPVELSIAEGAEEHPILNNVQLWDRMGKIYHNPDLGQNTEVLLFVEGLESNIYEPLAWTNKYGEAGRAFFTSMGLPADFDNENFLQLLFNAISWTTHGEMHRIQEND